MTLSLPTHRLAVSAFVIERHAFLLLKRDRAPYLWAPPAGRLEPDEHPDHGILREVREETGLTVRLLGPFDIWHGDFGRGLYVSIDYLATADSRQVTLSDEHVDFRWATLDELRAGNPPLGSQEPCFKIADFENAWSCYQTRMEQTQ